MADGGTAGVTVTTVMCDSVDIDEAVAFWTELLGLETVHRTERYAYLERLSADGPRLAFQLVPEPKAAKNRLHLDVRVPDMPAFVDRIVALGGTTVATYQDPGFPEWTVMQDPQGNEFCIYEAEE